MAEAASIERLGPVAVIRYVGGEDAIIGNRGAAAIDLAAGECLDDPSVRALILTGAGEGRFIRHADVASIARAGDALADGRIDEATFRDSPFARLCARLDHASKPVVAAIDGPCMGGGLEIALACTLRIAAEGVQAIGLPEIRIGIFPGGGGTQRLMRVMSPQRARRFILLGEVVDAAEAVSLGIVDEIAPDALIRAIEVARRLATRPPEAIAAVLETTRPRDDARLDEDAIAFARVVASASTRDRLRAFVARGERIDELP